MKKLRNIVIINDFDYVQGGASKVAIDTANILCDKYNVYYFSGASSENSSLDSRVKKVCTNQGESLKDKNKLRGALSGIYNFKARRELKKILSKLNKEETIIHVHGWTKSLSSSVFDISWKMGFKLVLTMHDYFTACPNGGYFNYKKNEICKIKPLSCICVGCNCDSRNYGFKIYRVIRQFVQNKIVRLNDRLTDVISISEFSEKILKRTLNKNTKIHRVYNPIDLDTKPEKADYKNNEYFLYVGRLSKEKGVDIFCDAITKTNVNGIVVGDGPELEHLKKEYPNIKFEGWKNSDEVKEYMKRAQALIFPSRWYEGAPLTPIEALQYGIPCITSDNCAAIDLINESNGFMFNIEKNNLINIISDFKNKSIELEEIDYDFEKHQCYSLKLLYIFNEILENTYERKN